MPHQFAWIAVASFTVDNFSQGERKNGSALSGLQYLDNPDLMHQGTYGWPLPDNFRIMDKN